MPGVIGTQVTVRWRLGDPTIDMVSESGRLVATHRKAPRGLGRVVRWPNHPVCAPSKAGGETPPRERLS